MILPTRPKSPWFEQKPAKDAKDYTTRKQLFLRELRVLLLKILITPQSPRVQYLDGLNRRVMSGFKRRSATPVAYWMPQSVG